MRHAAPLALLALALAAPAQAERRQFGNVIYDLPADWSVGTDEGGQQVLLFDGDEEVCPFCRLTIGAGASAQGDLLGWLSGQNLAFVDEDDRGSVEVVSPPELVGSGARTVAAMGQRVGSDVQMLFAFEASDRFELIGFEGWAYDEEELGRTMAYLASDVLPIVEGLTFASEGAEGVLPEAVPGSLDGLWWGWNQGFTMGLDMIMMPNVEFRTLAFWPDGRFYDGTPPGGLAALDPGSLGTDADWGTYREEGGAVLLAFADGRTERLSRRGDALTDDSRTLVEVRPLADGASLVGVTQNTSIVALGPATGDVSGAVVSESSRAYRADGTWTGADSGGATANFSSGGTATGGFSSSTEGAAQGTYEVRDGLLIATPADGSAPERALAFVNADGETMIGELFLETN